MDRLFSKNLWFLQEQKSANYKSYQQQTTNDKPIKSWKWLYCCVPGRTSSRIEPETAIQLSSVGNIIGIKEASGDLEAVRKIISGTDREKFVVLSGEDDLVADIMQMCGRGVISASANIAPRYFVRITEACLRGDYEEARRLQEEINPLVKQGVFYRKNPIPLAHMFDTELRLPLVKLPEIQAHLDEVLSQYSAVELGVDLRDYSREKE